VKATLLAIQGGIGNPPQREKLPSDVSTKHPDLPIVESTGSISFAGVLFFSCRRLMVEVWDRGGYAAIAIECKAPLQSADTERAFQADFSSMLMRCMVFKPTQCGRSRR
jgi:hypothetical protein